MGCFCWFSSNEKNVDRRRNGARRSAQQPAYPPRNDHNHIAPQPKNCKPRPPPESNDNKDARDHKEAASGSSHVMAAQTFTFRELAVATKNFRRECLVGEGGFGRVYKGKLDKSGQVVAVKQLDRNGLQGNREFLVEAQPVFKEPSRYPELADPLLQGGFPVRGLNQAVAVAAMCLQEEPLVRPLICDVVSALSLLGDGLEEGAEPAASFPSPPTIGNPDSAKERQLAVDEAIEWGSNSRRLASQGPSATAL
ncbi:hypothetical protein SADUNF_Sadunf02G0191400 [Salix dunnii]|uniref:Protein kinase domain-containing protein n=1 Tax=Salix dunnii TaxID=1413687 RepID=A0A835THZ2_9ROSI|nr:hypothetical protein SADUNF_Sadunf02G0191400 [Salix dunnii]